MKLLRIYIPVYMAKRKLRFFDSFYRKDKRTELIKFMSITLDEE